LRFVTTVLAAAAVAGVLGLGLVRCGGCAPKTR
jgi:hypothetical protein